MLFYTYILESNHEIIFSFQRMHVHPLLKFIIELYKSCNPISILNLKWQVPVTGVHVISFTRTIEFWFMLYSVNTKMFHISIRAGSLKVGVPITYMNIYVKQTKAL